MDDRKGFIVFAFYWLQMVTDRKLCLFSSDPDPAPTPPAPPPAKPKDTGMGLSMLCFH